MAQIFGIAPGWLIGAVMVAAVVGAAPVHASSAPDAGIAFEPPEPPPRLYGVQPPTTDPDRQVRIVPAADGTPLYTETWLPAEKDGNVPPTRGPVVLVYTPYSVKSGTESNGVPQGLANDDGTDYNAYIIPWLVERGYAVTYAHIRGTGGSGGCIEHTATTEGDDGARIVRDAGELAPWANGSLGMYGLSYNGGSQLKTATASDRTKLRSLRALLVGAPVSFYEQFYHDGVPEFVAEPAAQLAVFYIFNSPDSPEFLLQRPGCQPDPVANGITQSGDYAPYIAERDYKANLSRLEAPLLMWHGTADWNINGYVQAGLFDALPNGLPHKGVFGVHDHNPPDDHSFNESAYSSPQLDWEREDWEEIVVAWYERWLRGVRNGIGAWPTAQTQGTDGQWRSASTWPRIAGPRGALALGADGSLGATTPAGTTAYMETPPTYPAGTPDPPGSSAVFETPPLADRLELVGLPELDLWVSLEQPDSHVAVKLEALDAEGERTIYQAWTHGARSARHLDPLVGGNFRQAAGRPAPTGTPFKLALRFNPIDLVVPKGGRLRLTVAGTVESWNGADNVQEGTAEQLPGKTAGSGVVQEVTILHSCEYTSTLRFSLPERSSQLLDIREKDQTGPLGQRPNAPAPAVDGGGLATQPLCGAARSGSRCLNLIEGTPGGDEIDGTPGPDRLRGGDGRDLLRGRAGRDCVSGGDRRDRVSGGRGKDRLSGGRGRDVLRAADGVAESVRCGRGQDAATLDAADVQKGCERVSRPHSAP